MPVKHDFVSEVSDGDNLDLVRPVDWNADHTGMPVNGWYNAYPDYGSSRNAATAQAAIDACVAGGGGVVFLDEGTWALGGTSLTIGGSNVLLKGAGVQATYLTYSGTSGAIKNSDSSQIRYYCGAKDMEIRCLSQAGTGSSCLELDNFYGGTWRNLKVTGNGTYADSDCIRLIGTAAHKTYFNLFDHIIMWVTNGTCIHFTGGGVNRNFITNISAYGGSTSSYFVLMVPTITTHDTNMFINCSMQNTVHDPWVHLVYTSATEVCYYNTFLNIFQETDEDAPYSKFTIDDGNTMNQVIGGYIRNFDPGGDWGNRNMLITPSKMSLGAQYLGFYTATPIVKQTGVAVTAAAIHAALVNLGLIGA